MPDVIDQIQQQQQQQLEGDVASANKDFQWNNTFHPTSDQVLRDSRDMTSLLNRAIENRLRIRAQTDENAQKIYQNNEREKAWLDSQPLRDAHLRQETALAAAQEKAQLAQETLRNNQAERDANILHNTATAHWEMNQLEDGNASDADKLAWVRGLQGRYPQMDISARARLGEIQKRLTPQKDDVVLKREMAMEEYKQQHQSPKDFTALNQKLDMSINHNQAIKAAADAHIASMQAQMNDPAVDPRLKETLRTNLDERKADAARAEAELAGLQAIKSQRTQPTSTTAEGQPQAIPLPAATVVPSGGLQVGSVSFAPQQDTYTKPDTVSDNDWKTLSDSGKKRLMEHFNGRK